MATPQNVLFIYSMQGQLLNGSGPNAYEMVYWDSYNTPDLTGAQSGFPGQLQNIQIASVQQISSTTNTAVVPTSPATGDLSGNYPNPSVVGIQGNPVQAGTLGAAQDGYVLTYVNADGKLEMKPVAVNTPLGGDVTGPFGSNSVVSLSGSSNKVSVKTQNVDFANNIGSPVISQDALASTSTGSGASGTSLTIQGQAGQAATGPSHAGGQGGSVFIKGGAGGTSGSSTPGTSGGVEIQDATGQNAVNIIPSLGTIIEAAKTEIDLAINGTVQVAVTSGNVNIHSLAGSGSAPVQTDASGNLSRSTLGTNATSIQSTPVANVAPVNPSILQFDGYSGTTSYPTSYAPTGAPNKIIYGQNVFPISTITTAIDDTPVIQAYVNANPSCGTLRLVNCCMKNKVDFSPWATNNNVLEIQGQLLCAMDKAEIEMVPMMTIQGVGAYQSGGAFSKQSPQAQIATMNSTNSTLYPENNNLSTDGYVGGPLVNVYSFFPFVTLPDGYIGGTLHLTSVQNPTWDGYWTLIARNGVVTYITPQAGTNPVGVQDATDITWSINGLSGINGSNAGDGPLLCLRVYQCKGLQANSWKNWMSLNGAHYSLFNQKIHRIVGVEHYNGTYYTTAYIPAIFFGNTFTYGNWYTPVPTLPDYGSGSNPATANITVYEGYPVVRLVNNCTAKNITINFAQGPAFVMDGVMGLGGYSNIVVQECVASGSGTFTPANCHVPIIVDDVFFFDIRNCYFATTTGNQNASMLFTTTSGLNGEYCGIGRITNVNMYYYGVVIWDEGQLQAPVDLIFDSVIIDGVQNYQTTGFFALFIIGNNCGRLTIDNCAIADAGGVVYMIECLYPTGQAQGLLIRNSSGYVGPLLGTLANTSDVVMDDQLQQPNMPQWSGRSYGLTDNQEIGVGEDFSPVMTLPFQQAIPDLRTVAQWQALPATGSPSFSTLSSDGYTLVGPDGSSGKVIRMSGYPAGVTIATFNIANAQVGDIFLTFIRARSSNSYPLSYNGSGGAYLFGTGYPYYSPVFNNQNPLLNSSVAYLWYQNNWDNLSGGQWFETCTYSKVTGILGSGGPSTTVRLVINSSPFYDTIIDPESIAVMYIPVGTHASTVPATDIVRYYRKFRRQISSATLGDVAVPSRAGLSFGPSQFAGSRIQTDGYTTNSTSATTVFSYSVPNNQAFTLKVDWNAICPTHIADGYISGGSFNVVGYANNSGTTTVSSVNIFGSDYNVGTGGAAASAMTITHSTNLINIQAHANSSAATDWQLNIVQVNNS